MSGTQSLDLREMLIALLWIFPVGYGHTLWIVFCTEKGRSLSQRRKISAVVLPLIFAFCSLAYIKDSKTQSGPVLSWSYEGIWGRVDEGQPSWWIFGRSVAVEYDVIDGKCSRHPAVIVDSDHVRLADDHAPILQLKRGDFGTVVLEGDGDRAKYLMEGRDAICLGTNGRASSTAGQRD